MQAITTKFIHPTNHREPRVKAECDAGSIILDWPSSRRAGSWNPGDVHTLAAVALARKLGWDDPAYGGKLVRGGMPSKSPYAYVFVFMPSAVPLMDRDIITIDDEKWTVER